MVLTDREEIYVISKLTFADQGVVMLILIAAIILYYDTDIVIQL